MLEKKHFWCHHCKEYWQAEVDAEGNREQGTGNSAETEQSQKEGNLKDTTTNANLNIINDDPFRFIANCPTCGKETHNVPHYYANLENMHNNATGPITEYGKERVSGNALKHGKYAKVTRILAPANFEKYPQCAECDDRIPCASKQMTYCPYYLELMLRYIAAYKEGSVADLKELAGLCQAKSFILLQMAFDEIMQRGMVLVTPKVDKGEVVSYKKNATDLEKTNIMEITRHPLLKTLPELARMMGFDADSQKMTPKSADPDPTDNAGDLDGGKIKISDFVSNLAATITAAVQGIGSAAELRAKDLTHQKYNSTEKDRQEVEEQETGPDDNPFPVETKPKN